METVLKINNLSKKFGQEVALNQINMEIRRGDIYGLIGRNGAGKTTLLKIITQLMKQTDGTIQLFGEESHPGYLKQLSRTGSIIESPVAYEQLTALENLTYYCQLRGIAEKKAAEEALAFVGLQNTNKKKYKDFSLGMKQKLGLALALLGKPDFLILDEPINGLDPVAIVEFRQLLLRLHHELNMTILISSHILTELYQVANRFGIIHAGVMIEEISKQKFAEICQDRIHIEVDDAEEASRLLAEQVSGNFKVVSRFELNVYDSDKAVASINQLLVNAGLQVNAIYKTGTDLEEYFTQLISQTDAVLRGKSHV